MYCTDEKHIEYVKEYRKTCESYIAIINMFNFRILQMLDELNDYKYINR